MLKNKSALCLYVAFEAFAFSSWRLMQTKRVQWKTNRALFHDDKVRQPFFQEVDNLDNLVGNRTRFSVEYWEVLLRS